MGVIALADLKSHLGISDTDSDTTLTNAVNATNDAVRQFCRRSFDKDTNATARTYQPTSSIVTFTDDFHETASLVVKTDEDDDGTFETTWATTDYQLEPLNGIVDGVSGWPYSVIRAVDAQRFPTRGRRVPVEVTAKWGWAAVPGPVFEGALIKATRVFKRKDSPLGISGVDPFGPVRISTREDPDVAMLLGPYVRLLVR